MALVRVQYTSIGFGVRTWPDCKLAWGGRVGRSFKLKNREKKKGRTEVRPYIQGQSQMPIPYNDAAPENVCKTHQLEHDAEPAERSAGSAPRGGETVDRSDGFKSNRVRDRVR